MSDNSKQKDKNAPYPAEFPPVTEHFFNRPSIDRMLQAAFEKPLTTVIAGAGYGKTQAVSCAVSGMARRSAWVQLSKLDNHAARFWERMARAMRPWSPNLYSRMTSIGYPESFASFDRFLKLLTEELTQQDAYILVLDDFYLIDTPSILHFLELFISARVPRFSIVLISRKKPDLSLSGMLSKGLLARITEDDLRFSPEEMTDYFRTQGITLHESVLSEVYAYTEGWIFAIYLVGLAAKKGELQNPVYPAKVDIFNLIDKEIFAAASPDLQEFLLRISVLDVFPSELVKILAKHNLSLISEMLQISMFIRYDAFSGSYRIHHLFLEFLREKTADSRAPDFVQTHLAAAGWYAQNNHYFDALDHYLAIGRYDAIFDIIIAIPGRVPYGSANALIELLDQAPKELIQARPLIRVAKAGYLFNNNRLDEAKQELSALREELEAQPEAPHSQAVLGEVYLLLAVICMIETDYAFEELFVMASERLPDGSKLVDYRTGMAEGINACSILDPSAGELQRYQDALFRAAPYAAHAMNRCCYGLEYLNAAESSLYTGDWQAAEKNAFEAIYRARQYMQYDIEYMANFVLVRIYTAKGYYDKVTGVLDQLKAQLETIQHADCFYLYDMIDGWFYTKLGKTGQVAGWIRHEEEAKSKIAPVVIGREYLVRSDCLLAEERYYELLAFMEQTDKLYESRGILFAVIQNKITKAILYHYMGDHEQSIQNLNAAYSLSYPNHLIMQYIEYGNKMRTLLRRAKQDKRCVIPGDWLDQLYTKSSSYAKMLSQIVSAYDSERGADSRSQIHLSKREAEVLTYLYRGMTRKEMAARCYVSLSSINSLLKNIYNKLGAANAADAVRIAKEMRFL